MYGRTRVDLVGDSDRIVESGDSPNALVTEFAEYGDLAVYLGDLCDSGVGEPLSLKHRLLIGEQIVEGMIAVHATNIIHRDLAARNIMVFDMDPTDISRTLVKVNDYGISAQAGAGGYLRTGGNTVAPIRYMAPEALRRRVWTKESDVWSWGVVMWEIFADGAYPYMDIGSDEEVALRVRDGGLRLSQPPTCPDDVWALIQTCWEQDRNHRPSFSQLKIRLQTLRNELDIGRGVKTLTCRIRMNDSEDPIDVAFQPNDRVQALCEWVLALYGVEIGDQYVFHRGVLMRCADLLSDYDLCDGADIMVVSNLFMRINRSAKTKPILVVTPEREMFIVLGELFLDTGLDSFYPNSVIQRIAQRTGYNPDEFCLYQGKTSARLLYDGVDRPSIVYCYPRITQKRIIEAFTEHGRMSFEIDENDTIAVLKLRVSHTEEYFGTRPDFLRVYDGVNLLADDAVVTASSVVLLVGEGPDYVTEITDSSAYYVI
jgi:hypothetical protein